ncbi:unnamed protein product [Camellia sinensis]
MDGRRWWLDIEKLGSNEKGHFVLATNLVPCSGIRLHLWPEKRKSTSDLPVGKKVLEVTQKMVHIPSGPTPRQTVSGRPPPAASMAVGQFFSPKDGELELSRQLLLLSTYSPKDIILKEDHPLDFNMSFAISLGLFPVKLSLETTGCGIKKSVLPVEEAGDLENGK